MPQVNVELRNEVEKVKESMHDFFVKLDVVVKEAVRRKEMGTLTEQERTAINEFLEEVTAMMNNKRTGLKN